MQKIINFLKSNIFANVLFWGFNSLYLLVSALFSVAILSLLGSIDINISLALTLNIISILPILSIILYFKKDMKENPVNILTLFFGFEMPVFVLCLIRVLALRELTGIYVFIFFSLFAGIALLLAELSGYKSENKHIKTAMTLVYETIMIIGAYLSFLALFYAVLLFAGLVKHLISINYIEVFVDWLQFVFSTGFISAIVSYLFLAAIFIFFIFAMFLALLTPVISFVLFYKKFQEKQKELQKPIITGAFAILYLFLGLCLSLQFNGFKFQNELTQYRNEVNFEKRQELSKQFLKNHSGIQTDKYLARYKYFSDNNADGVKYLFSKNLGFDSKASVFVQNIFNKCALPFVYQDKFDAKNANDAYQELFDENIQFAQKSKIQHAMKSTLFASQQDATLLDLDAKNVLLQEKYAMVEFSKNSPAATVKIVETYKNMTNVNKEVYYEFSLPENSVITDLKLGDNLQYQGKISPKGAARKTYESQVRINRDPALLEKAGPRQYTLRVYPVEPRAVQKVQLEYVTLIKDGKVGLPVFSQKRNVFDRISTKCNIFVNNEPTKPNDDGTISVWFEESDTVYGFEYNKKYYYLSGKKQDVNIESLKKYKTAMLLDTSYSDKTNWARYLNEDKIFEKVKNDKMDFYFFNDRLGTKIKNLDDIEQINFGATKRLDAINKVGSGYDLIVMLTDSSVFDKSDKIVKDIKTPIYIIHTNSEIPPYINELTTTILKSNGGIASSLEDAFEKFLIKQNKNIISLDDEYVWSASAVKNIAVKPDDNLQKLFYSKIINELLKNGDVKNIDLLEKVHKIAKEQGIVCDYSSYIALVNKQQEDLLALNEESQDKFSANMKTGQDNLVNDDPLEIQAVPEPQEWLLILTGFVFLLIMFFRKKLRCIH